MCETKNNIILKFKEKIKGKIVIIDDDTKHDGSEGHWLEKQMDIKPNCSKNADIGGYEMKKESNKITFGDWKASEYLFENKNNLLKDINKKKIIISKKSFIKYFGNKTSENRYSWSGSCIPKYGNWNTNGQTLKIDDDNNILALYSYKKDCRKIEKLKKLENIGEICIAIWSENKMKEHINKKYNQNGFFICKKDKNGLYNKICFGSQINFELFIKKIKSGDIYLDSGMYYDTLKPNNRIYSQWRAGKTFWNSLIIEEY